MGLLVPKRKSLIRPSHRMGRTITVRDGIVSATRDGQKRITGRENISISFDFDWRDWSVDAEADVVVSYTATLDYSVASIRITKTDDLEDDDGKIVRAPDSAARSGAEAYLKSSDGQAEMLDAAKDAADWG